MHKVDLARMVAVQQGTLWQQHTSCDQKQQLITATKKAFQLLPGEMTQYM